METFTPDQIQLVLTRKGSTDPDRIAEKKNLIEQVSKIFAKHGVTKDNWRAYLKQLLSLQKDIIKLVDDYMESLPSDYFGESVMELNEILDIKQHGLLKAFDKYIREKGGTDNELGLMREETEDLYQELEKTFDSVSKLLTTSLDVLVGNQLVKTIRKHIKKNRDFWMGFLPLDEGEQQQHDSEQESAKGELARWIAKDLPSMQPFKSYIKELYSELGVKDPYDQMEFFKAFSGNDELRLDRQDKMGQIVNETFPKQTIQLIIKSSGMGKMKQPSGFVVLNSFLENYDQFMSTIFPKDSESETKDSDSQSQ